MNGTEKCRWCDGVGFRATPTPRYPRYATRCVFCAGKGVRSADVPCADAKPDDAS